MTVKTSQAEHDEEAGGAIGAPTPSRHWLHRNPGAPTPFGMFYPPDEAWLARAEPEPILDPELAIIDTHHHLWDMPGYRYLMPEFMADVRTGHNVIATVFSEALAMYRAHGPIEMRPVGEVEFCAGMAAMSESGIYGPTRVNAGIVGFADLTLGDRLAAVLEAEIAAGGGRLSGVRHGGAFHPDPTIGKAHGASGPGLFLEPTFQAGLKQVAGYNLSFDAWVFHHQMDDVFKLARACPEARIVVVHMGSVVGYGPYAGRRDEVFSEWRASMAALATCENVTMKLCPTMIRLASFDYGRSEIPPTSEILAQYWKPYVKTAIELFGPSRCMVESNFPVEKIVCGYATIWNTFKRVLSDLSSTEKRQVFSETAIDVYNLKLGERGVAESSDATSMSSL